MPEDTHSERLTMEILLARIQALEERIEAETRGMENVRGQGGRSEATALLSKTNRAETAGGDESALLSRRGWLSAAVLGAAGVAGVDSVLHPGIAAAANGDIVTVGGIFTGSSNTTLDTSGTPGNTAIVGASSGDGTGVEGTNFDSGGTHGYGVYGLAGAGTGVRGDSSGGNGVFGFSDSGNGVVGQSLFSTGVQGFGLTGVQGQGDSGPGVSGLSASGSGVYGESTNATGMQGKGVTYGVFAENTGSGPGVYGSSVSGTGVQGLGLTGVQGQGYTGPGVSGLSADHTGLYGESINATGVQGKGATYGVFAEGTSGYRDRLYDIYHAKEKEEDHGSAEPAPPTKSPAHALTSNPTQKSLTICRPVTMRQVYPPSSGLPPGLVSRRPPSSPSFVALCPLACLWTAEGSPAAH